MTEYLNGIGGLATGALAQRKTWLCTSLCIAGHRRPR